MIVAIYEGHILAHTDLASEIEELAYAKLPKDWKGTIRFRPASYALQKLIESGADLESIRLSITDVADLAQELSMDPALTLAEALSHYRRDEFDLACEKLDYYKDWRSKGGFAPEVNVSFGDRRERSIGADAFARLLRLALDNNAAPVEP